MTRLSSKPIGVPAGVTVSVADNVFTVAGSKGTVSRVLSREVVLEMSEDGRALNVTPAPNAKDVNHLVGSFYAHARNMILGVSVGFIKVLELEGIGYRASVEGKDLLLSLGFSHPIRYTAPSGIDIAVEKNEIRVSGIDKEMVGQVAAVIREYRKPEPYKGKGIHYKGEHIIRKAGKKAGVGA
ncbi:MAG: 50S ribosomal protein L6 [Candidatus Ryanbacteria bacterium RIFCSPHIGHO2_02_FULL_45_17b]|uniref:Large ribosomal subunit protein uL6 n=1 Tax=Candidatus Ryanbacteria bacterium RIFCSPHIGHO2_01_FULL_45_22 TaxID=1802114 RepID=A0A1G2G2M6_9BACT|nr:MAG: 50S ribosomal protein L6 [Candidatus Ryanbacteria bacterium RIFCSPHIGHO2_01_FULL_45_22]OGZ46458.1 MAG: 50S ribosomal protein L6 [Candidatus Ryanbacteria bacterium RIFCSPHIGHO2_02_FULL_45_17b]